MNPLRAAPSTPEVGSHARTGGAAEDRAEDHFNRKRFSQIVAHFRDDVQSKWGDWVCGYTPLVTSLGFAHGARNSERVHLELGSGHGALACALKFRFGLGKVVGCDVEPQAVQESTRRAEAMSKVLGLAPPLFHLIGRGEELPFPSETFTSASCCFVLSGAVGTPEAQLSFLRNVAAVLRPGGTFAFCVNNPATVGTRFTSLRLELSASRQKAANPNNPNPPAQEEREGQGTEEGGSSSGEHDKLKTGQKMTAVFYDTSGEPYLRCNDKWWPRDHYEALMKQAGFEDVISSATPFGPEDEEAARLLGIPVDDFSPDAPERLVSPVLLVVGRKAMAGSDSDGDGDGSSGNNRPSLEEEKTFEVKRRKV